MANIQRFRHSSGLDFDVPLKFLPSSWLASGRGDGGSPTLLNTWAAFGTAMLIIAPLVKKEQMFFLPLFTTLDVTGMGQQVPRNDMDGNDSPPKSMAEEMMDVLFASLMSKLQKLCGLIPSNSAAAATGGHEAVDGMETIAILVVLQQFMNDHLGILPSFLGVSTISDGLLNPPLMAQISMATTSTTMTAKPVTVMEDFSTYLVSMLFSLRKQLLQRLRTFMTEQMTWIQTQKSDPKKAGVALPVAKFPSFVRQVLEMTGGQVCY